MVNWYIQKPPKHIITKYEKMKTAYTTELNRKITLELQQIEGTLQAEQVEKKVLTSKQQIAFELYKEHKSQEKVSELMNISIPAVNIHLKLAKKKGYTLEIDEIKYNKQ